MASSFNKFNNFVQNLGAKQFDFSADTFKVMLTNTAPVATNSAYSDISSNELANGNGYTTAGTAATITSWLNSSGTSKWILQPVTFTATGSMGPFRYAVLYDSTTGKLVGWWDYGSSITPVSGNTFTVQFDGTAGVLTVA
jgi:hypothetical protein